MALHKGPLSLALVAHDNKKNEMVQLVTEYKSLLEHEHIHIVATHTTGTWKNKFIKIY